MSTNQEKSEIKNWLMIPLPKLEYGDYSGLISKPEINRFQAITDGFIAELRKYSILPEMLVKNVKIAIDYEIETMSDYLPIEEEPEPYYNEDEQYERMANGDYNNGEPPRIHPLFNTIIGNIFPNVGC